MKKMSLSYLLNTSWHPPVSQLRVPGRVILRPGVGLHQGARHALEGPAQLGKLGELAGLGDGSESAMNC